MDIQLSKDSIGRFCIILITLIGLIAFRDHFFARTALLTETPSWLKTLSLLIATALCGYTIWQLNRFQPFRGGRIQKFWAGLSFLGVMCYACLNLAEWGFEMAAFSSDVSAPYRQPVRIEDVLSDKGPGYKVYVKDLHDGFGERVFVTADVYYTLAAIRPPLFRLSDSDPGYCFILWTEQGRWGATRVSVPALWDNGVSTIYRCSGMPPKI